MGTLSDENAKRVGIDPRGLHEGGSGGGGGLTEWDSETEYATDQIVLDRGGIWKATGTNTHSRPIPGNTDWELVGGTPYLDVVVTPPEQITPPFFQEGGVPGNDGLTLIPSPGVGKFVTWTSISSQTSDGSNFSDSGPHVFYQGLNNPDYSVNDLVQPNQFQVGAPDNGMIIPVGSVENLPVLIATSSGLSSSATDCSLLYRVWYQIHDVVPVQFVMAGSFYIIEVVDQGTKTFTLPVAVYDIGATISVVGSTGNDGDYTVVSSTPNDPNRPITAVNQGAKKFVIAGDHTADFSPDGTAVVSGSTGNDGFYTIVSSTFTGGNTEIVVAETIPDPTASGTINSAGELKTDIVVAEAIPDPTADGWVKQ